MGQGLLQKVGDHRLHVKAGDLGDGFQNELKTFLLLPEDRHVIVNDAQDLQQLHRESQSQRYVVISPLGRERLRASAVGVSVADGL